MVAVRTAKEQIGFMPHRVEVQRPVEVRNQYGENEHTYETVVICWALVRPLRGKEFWSAQQLQSSLTHKITMRLESLVVRPGWRLLFRDRILDIKTVQDVESARFQVEIMATEQVPQQ
jgi:SPP1 family predicted phage head-tail adaptor